MILKNPKIQPKTIKVEFGVSIILAHPSIIMIDILREKRNIIKCFGCFLAIQR